MKPFYKTETDEIFNGHVMPVLKYLKSEKYMFDAIISDPPYKVITGGNNQKRLFKTSVLKENNNFGWDNLPKIEEWLPKSLELLKEKGHIYIMTNSLNLRYFLNVIEDNKLHLHNIIIWDKGNQVFNRWYMKSYEIILFCKRKKDLAKVIKNIGTSNILRIPNPKDKLHPTEKPIELIDVFIQNSTNENDVILDMFGGSFSTIIAAEENNRRSVGIDISKEYCEIGKKRLQSMQIKLKI